MKCCVPMQTTLSKCSSLRHLALCEWVDPQEKLTWKDRESDSERRDVDWLMVLELSEELPSLVVLELQLEGYASLQMSDSGSTQTAAKQETAAPSSSEKRSRLHFDQELIRSIVQSDAAGLQLVQIECGIGREQAYSMDLPPRLRYLSSCCRSDSYNALHRMHLSQLSCSTHHEAEAWTSFKDIRTCPSVRLVYLSSNTRALSDSCACDECNPMPSSGCSSAQCSLMQHIWLICSSAADDFLYTPMPRSLEEVVLFLDTSASVSSPLYNVEMTNELDVVLATLLLPSASTLKAVLLLHSFTRGFVLVCVSLPLLGIYCLAVLGCLCRRGLCSVIARDV